VVLQRQGNWGVIQKGTNAEGIKLTESLLNLCGRGEPKVIKDDKRTREGKTGA